MITGNATEVKFACLYYRELFKITVENQHAVLQNYKMYLFDVFIWKRTVLLFQESGARSTDENNV